MNLKTGACGEISYFISSLYYTYFWAHLELGVGNYGDDGHCKVALDKTVFMKVKHVTSEANFSDDLEEIGCGNYDPEVQYGVLFWTLDELVFRYGDCGVFHVNDLLPEYAEVATDRLREYAISKG